MAEQETRAPRCKYCVAGNRVNKDGWHVLETIQGYTAHEVFCDELIAVASDNMAKSK